MERLEERVLLDAQPLGFDDFPDRGEWSAAAAIAIDPVTGQGSRHGVLEDRYDTDLFAFTALGTGQARIRLDTPSSNLDPYLYLYDSAQRLIAWNDDFNGLDSQVTTNVTAGQRYFVVADNYADWSSGSYVVSVALAPVQPDDYAGRGEWSSAKQTPMNSVTGTGSVQGSLEERTDTDLFRFVAPMSGDAVIRLDTPNSNLDTYLYVYDGASYGLLASNDDFNGRDSQVTISVTAGRGYFVLADNYADGSTGSYTLSVSIVASLPDDFADAGDWPNAAQIVTSAVTGRGSVSGALEERRDTDLFRFTALATGPAAIRMDTPASNLDPYLYVYDSTHRLIAWNDDFNGLDSQVTISVTGGHAYFILADNYGDYSTGPYTINIEGPRDTRRQRLLAGVPMG